MSDHFETLCIKGLKKNAKNIESNDSNEDDSSGSEEDIEYDET